MAYIATGISLRSDQGTWPCSVWKVMDWTPMGVSHLMTSYISDTHVFIFHLFRSTLLRRCWSQEPLRRPKPSEIVRILIETPDMVHACIDVPGTTLLDNSMSRFDARKATGRAREWTESPQSNHSFPFDHVRSTMNLTAKQRDNRIARKHSTKPEATRTKWHSSKLWRKTSVQF